MDHGIRTTPQQPTPPQTCPTCQGHKGAVIDTSSNGITRQHWQTCTPCSGTGIKGGGC